MHFVHPAYLMFLPQSYCFVQNVFLEKREYFLISNSPLFKNEKSLGLQVLPYSFFFT